MKFATRTIHAGQPSEPETGAIVAPIFQTSTYEQEAPGQDKGFSYSRTNNPTRQRLETVLAELEGVPFAAAFASGLAAENAVLQAYLRAGDEIIIPLDVYGGTYRILNRVYQNFGIVTKQIDTSDVKAVEAALSPKTRLVWIESPTNPRLLITDIAAVAALARDCGALTVVDNTFLSPAWQLPLTLGADLVVHSTTKYLNGHSDVVGGAVVAREARLHEELLWWANCLGLTGAPFDSFLTLRGLRTLHARLEHHARNAHALAHWLEGQPNVTRVWYPGLRSHPGHELARRQQRAFGAVVTLELEGGHDAVREFVADLECFSLAESLGGVESLVAHPATMTHAAMEPAARARAGLTDGLIRLSIGIEALEDLRADLARALSRAASVRPARRLRQAAAAG